MAEIRLSKLTKKYNIGLSTIVEYLRSEGADVEMNPNTRISDSYIPLLDKKFGEDLKAVQEANQVDIKMKEIIEKNSRKQKDDEEEEEAQTLVKTTGITPMQPKATVQEKEPQVSETPSTDTPGAPVDMDDDFDDEPFTESDFEEAAKKDQQDQLARLGAESRRAQEKESVSPSQDRTETSVPDSSEVPSDKEDNKSQGSTPAGSEDMAASQGQGTPAPEQATSGEEIITPTASDIAITIPGTPSIKVVGKVDLSQFETPKKKKKRERIAKDGSRKVEIGKVDTSADASDASKKKGQDAKKDSGKKDGAKAAKGTQGKDTSAKGKDAKEGKKKKDKRGGSQQETFKPAMTEAEEEEMQKEIQKQVKETYARMNESKKSNFGAKYRKEKREAAATKMQEEMAAEMADRKILRVTEFVTVNDLATLMNNTPVNKVITACFNLGLMVSINQRLDAEALVLVAEEFGYQVEFVTAELTQEINQEEDSEFTR